MSVSLLKGPNYRTPFATPIYPHKNTGEANITFFDSVEYELHEDFMYQVKISNYINSTIFKNLIPPLLDNTHTLEGASYYNIIIPTKDLVYYDYDPTITTLTAAEHQIAKYEISLTNYWNNETQDTEYTMDCIVGNQSLNVFNDSEIDQVDMSDYMCNASDKKFLTTQEGIVRFKIDDEASWKVYNTFQVITSLNPTIDYFKYEVKKEDGSSYTFKIDQDIVSSNSMDVLSGATLQIPIAPKNLSTSQYVTSMTMTNGFVFYPNTNMNIELELTDTYTIRAYDSSDNPVSILYRFEIYCDVHSNLVSWENALGGTEYYNFSKREQIVVNTNKSYYERSKYDWMKDSASGWDTMFDRKRKKSDYVLRDEYKETYKLAGDILTRSDYSKMKSLLYSKNIEILIEGKWYAAILQSKSTREVHYDDFGPKYYKLALLVDKNISLI